MKTSFLFTFFLLSLLSAWAQVTFHKTFTTSYIVSPVVSNSTPDGGSVMAATVSSINPTTPLGSIFIIRTDSVGDVVFSKTYDSLYSFAEPRGVVSLKEGGFCLVGNVIDYDTTGFGGDIFLIRTNDTGKVLWQKSFGGKGSESASAIVQSFDGGFIVLGSTSTFGMYVIRTDSLGTIVWTKTYGDTVPTIPNGRFIQPATSGYIIGGESPTGTLPNDFSLIKIDETGAVIWSKAYGGIYPEKLFAFNTTSDGGFLMGGYSQSFNPNHNQRDAYLIKTDSNGAVLWAKTYSRPSYFTSIRSVMETHDGGYIASVAADTSGTAGDITLLKVNSLGDVDWARRIGQPNMLESGLVTGQTPDSGFMVAGELSTQLPSTNLSVYLVKTDLFGESTCYTDTFSYVGTSGVPIINSISFTLFGSLDSSTNLTSYPHYVGSDSTLCFNNPNTITEVQTNEFSVFPNPTSNLVTIHSKQKITHIEVTNSLGVLVYKSNLNNTKTMVDLGNYAEGLYYYIAKTEHGNTECGKLLVLH